MKEMVWLVTFGLSLWLFFCFLVFVFWDDHTESRVQCSFLFVFLGIFGDFGVGHEIKEQQAGQSGVSAATSILPINNDQEHIYNTENADVDEDNNNNNNDIISNGTRTKTTIKNFCIFTFFCAPVLRHVVLVYVFFFCFWTCCYSNCSFCRKNYWWWSTV